MYYVLASIDPRSRSPGLSYSAARARADGDTLDASERHPPGRDDGRVREHEASPARAGGGRHGAPAPDADTRRRRRQGPQDLDRYTCMCIGRRRRRPARWRG